MADPVVNDNRIDIDDAPSLTETCPRCGGWGSLATPADPTVAPGPATPDRVARGDTIAECTVCSGRGKVTRATLADYLSEQADGS